MRKTRKVGLALVATAASAIGVGLMPSAVQAAPPSGSAATGVQHVTYTGNGYTCTDWINRSASGNVTEWRPAGGCSPDADGNSTLLFKPTSATKPASCDRTNLIKSFTSLTYGSGFGLYTVTSGYKAGSNNQFWTPGQAYLVCFYPLAYRATGDFDWTAYSDMPRHVTFDVHTAGYGINTGGTFSYADASGGSYTVSPSCVSIDGASGSVLFGGPVQNPSDPSWSSYYLYAKAVAPNQYWGSFVTSDPCPTLGAADPADGPFTPTSGTITVAPIIG